MEVVGIGGFPFVYGCRTKITKCPGGESAITLRKLQILML
jgi:hypothetical protein